jgi:TonB family protein
VIVGDELPRTTILEGIKQMRPKVMACKRDITGVVKVKIAVAASGTVTGVTVVETPDAGLAECVVAAIKGSKFPASPGGGSFQVPFSF